MSDDERHIPPAHLAAADSLINHLIANPPPKRVVDPAKRWPETERARAIGGKALQEIRELACKRTGMTMAQLLEAEGNVHHDTSPIAVQNTPEVARSRMKLAKVPELYTKCVVDRAPIECQALGHVRQFLGSKRNFLVLAGGKGVYKSGSAAWALGQVDAGAFVDAMHLVEISINEKERWQRILSAPLVVVDDLGTEKRDPGSLAVFMDAFQKIHNGAYSNCRRVIYTGNISKSGMNREPEDGGYGTRAYDRLKEAGDWYGIQGESVRSPSMHWAERAAGEEG